MKTLCVAIVVLSLTSVCQPASLACEKLLNPEDKSPDLSGRWHVIAISASNCFVPKVLNALFWPSIAHDGTAKDTPNICDIKIKVNINGYCFNKSKTVFYDNNTMSDVDSNNVSTSKPTLLLQTVCPDCLVFKRDDALKTLTLYSRRKNVTAAELKEFEVQAECLGWTKPQVLKSDHDNETCKLLRDNITDSDSQAVLSMLKERLRNIQNDLLKCDPKYFSSSGLATFLEN